MYTFIFTNLTRSKRPLISFRNAYKKFARSQSRSTEDQQNQLEKLQESEDVTGENAEPSETLEETKTMSNKPCPSASVAHIGVLPKKGTSKPLMIKSRRNYHTSSVYYAKSAKRKYNTSRNIGFINEHAQSLYQKAIEDNKVVKDRQKKVSYKLMQTKRLSDDESSLKSNDSKKSSKKIKRARTKDVKVIQPDVPINLPPKPRIYKLSQEASTTKRKFTDETSYLLNEVAQEPKQKPFVYVIGQTMSGMMSLKQSEPPTTLPLKHTPRSTRLGEKGELESKTCVSQAAKVPESKVIKTPELAFMAPLKKVTPPDNKKLRRVINTFDMPNSTSALVEETHRPALKIKNLKYQESKQLRRVAKLTDVIKKPPNPEVGKLKERFRYPAGKYPSEARAVEHPTVPPNPSFGKLKDEFKTKMVVSETEPKVGQKLENIREHPMRYRFPSISKVPQMLKVRNAKQAAAAASGTEEKNNELETEEGATKETEEAATGEKQAAEEEQVVSHPKLLVPQKGIAAKYPKRIIAEETKRFDIEEQCIRENTKSNFSAACDTCIDLKKEKPDTITKLRPLAIIRPVQRSDTEQNQSNTEEKDEPLQQEPPTVSIEQALQRKAKLAVEELSNFVKKLQAFKERTSMRKQTEFMKMFQDRTQSASQILEMKSLDDINKEAREKTALAQAARSHSEDTRSLRSSRMEVQEETDDAEERGKQAEEEHNKIAAKKKELEKKFPWSEKQKNAVEEALLAEKLLIEEEEAAAQRKAAAERRAAAQLLLEEQRRVLQDIRARINKKTMDKPPITFDKLKTESYVLEAAHIFTPDQIIPGLPPKVKDPSVEELSNVEVVHETTPNALPILENILTQYRMSNQDVEPKKSCKFPVTEAVLQDAKSRKVKAEIKKCMSLIAPVVDKRQLQSEILSHSKVIKDKGTLKKDDPKHVDHPKEKRETTIKPAVTKKEKDNLYDSEMTELQPEIDPKKKLEFQLSDNDTWEDYKLSLSDIHKSKDLSIGYVSMKLPKEKAVPLQSDEPLYDSVAELNKSKNLSIRYMSLNLPKEVESESTKQDIQKVHEELTKYTEQFISQEPTQVHGQDTEAADETEERLPSKFSLLQLDPPEKQQAVEEIEYFIDKNIILANSTTHDTRKPMKENQDEVPVIPKKPKDKTEKKRPSNYDKYQPLVKFRYRGKKLTSPHRRNALKDFEETHMNLQEDNEIIKNTMTNEKQASYVFENPNMRLQEKQTVKNITKNQENISQSQHAAINEKQTSYVFENPIMRLQEDKQTVKNIAINQENISQSQPATLHAASFENKPRPPPIPKHPPMPPNQKIKRERPKGPKDMVLPPRSQNPIPKKRFDAPVSRPQSAPIQVKSNEATESLKYTVTPPMTQRPQSARVALRSGTPAMQTKAIAKSEEITKINVRHAQKHHLKPSNSVTSPTDNAQKQCLNRPASAEIKSRAARSEEQVVSNAANTAAPSAFKWPWVAGSASKEVKRQIDNSTFKWPWATPCPEHLRKRLMAEGCYTGLEEDQTNLTKEEAEECEKWLEYIDTRIRQTDDKTPGKGDKKVSHRRGKLATKEVPKPRLEVPKPPRYYNIHSKQPEGVQQQQDAGPRNAKYKFTKESSPRHIKQTARPKIVWPEVLQKKTEDKQPEKKVEVQNETMELMHPEVIKPVDSTKDILNSLNQDQDCYPNKFEVNQNQYLLEESRMLPKMRVVIEILNAVEPRKPAATAKKTESPKTSESQEQGPTTARFDSQETAPTSAIESQDTEHTSRLDKGQVKETSRLDSQETQDTSTTERKETEPTSGLDGSRETQPSRLEGIQSQDTEPTYRLDEIQKKEPSRNASRETQPSRLDRQETTATYGTESQDAGPMYEIQKTATTSGIKRRDAEPIYRLDEIQKGDTSQSGSQKTEVEQPPKSSQSVGQNVVKIETDFDLENQVKADYAITQELVKHTERKRSDLVARALAKEAGVVITSEVDRDLTDPEQSTTSAVENKNELDDQSNTKVKEQFSPKPTEQFTNRNPAFNMNYKTLYLSPNVEDYVLGQKVINFIKNNKGERQKSKPELAKTDDAVTTSPKPEGVLEELEQIMSTKKPHMEVPYNSLKMFKPQDVVEAKPEQQQTQELNEADEVAQHENNALEDDAEAEPQEPHRRLPNKMALDTTKLPGRRKEDGGSTERKDGKDVTPLTKPTIAKPKTRQFSTTGKNESNLLNDAANKIKQHEIQQAVPSNAEVVDKTKMKLGTTAGPVKQDGDETNANRIITELASPTRKQTPDDELTTVKGNLENNKTTKIPSITKTTIRSVSTTNAEATTPNSTNSAVKSSSCTKTVTKCSRSGTKTELKRSSSTKTHAESPKAAVKSSSNATIKSQSHKKTSNTNNLKSQSNLDVMTKAVDVTPTAKSAPSDSALPQKQLFKIEEDIKESCFNHLYNHMVKLLDVKDEKPKKSDIKNNDNISLDQWHNPVYQTDGILKAETDRKNIYNTENIIKEAKQAIEDMSSKTTNKQEGSTEKNSMNENDLDIAEKVKAIKEIYRSKIPVSTHSFPRVSSSFVEKHSKKDSAHEIPNNNSSPSNRRLSSKKVSFKLENEDATTEKITRQRPGDDKVTPDKFVANADDKVKANRRASVVEIYKNNQTSHKICREKRHYYTTDNQSGGKSKNYKKIEFIMKQSEINEIFKKDKLDSILEGTPQRLKNTTDPKQAKKVVDIYVNKFNGRKSKDAASKKGDSYNSTPTGRDMQREDANQNNQTAREIPNKAPEEELNDNLSQFYEDVPSVKAEIVKIYDKDQTPTMSKSRSFVKYEKFIPLKKRARSTTDRYVFESKSRTKHEEFLPKKSSSKRRIVLTENHNYNDKQLPHKTYSNKELLFPDSTGEHTRASNYMKETKKRVAEINMAAKYISEREKRRLDETTSKREKKLQQYQSQGKLEQPSFGEANLDTHETTTEQTPSTESLKSRKWCASVPPNQKQSETVSAKSPRSQSVDTLHLGKRFILENNRDMEIYEEVTRKPKTPVGKQIERLLSKDNLQKEIQNRRTHAPVVTIQKDTRRSPKEGMKVKIGKRTIRKDILLGIPNIPDQIQKILDMNKGEGANELNQKQPRKIEYVLKNIKEKGRTVLEKARRDESADLDAENVEKTADSKSEKTILAQSKKQTELKPSKENKTDVKAGEESNTDASEYMASKDIVEDLEDIKPRAPRYLPNKDIVEGLEASTSSKDTAKELKSNDIIKSSAAKYMPSKETTEEPVEVQKTEQQSIRSKLPAFVRKLLGTHEDKPVPNNETEKDLKLSEAEAKETTDILHKLLGIKEDEIDTKPIPSEESKSPEKMKPASPQSSKKSEERVDAKQDIMSKLLGTQESVADKPSTNIETKVELKEDISKQASSPEVKEDTESIPTEGQQDQKASAATKPSSSLSSKDTAKSELLVKKGTDVTTSEKTTAKLESNQTEDMDKSLGSEEDVKVTKTTRGLTNEAQKDLLKASAEKMQSHKGATSKLVTQEVTKDRKPSSTISTQRQKDLKTSAKTQEEKVPPKASSETVPSQPDDKDKLLAQELTKDKKTNATRTTQGQKDLKTPTKTREEKHLPKAETVQAKKDVKDKLLTQEFTKDKKPTATITTQGQKDLNTPAKTRDRKDLPKASAKTDVKDKLRTQEITKDSKPTLTITSEGQKDLKPSAKIREQKGLLKPSTETAPSQKNVTSKLLTQEITKDRKSTTTKTTQGQKDLKTSAKTREEKDLPKASSGTVQCQKDVKTQLFTQAVTNNTKPTIIITKEQKDRTEKGLNSPQAAIPISASKEVLEQKLANTMVSKLLGPQDLQKSSKESLPSSSQSIKKVDKTEFPKTEELHVTDKLMETIPERTTQSQAQLNPATEPKQGPEIPVKLKHVDHIEMLEELKHMRKTTIEKDTTSIKDEVTTAKKKEHESRIELKTAKESPSLIGFHMSEMRPVIEKTIPSDLESKPVIEKPIFSNLHFQTSDTTADSKPETETTNVTSSSKMTKRTISVKPTEESDATIKQIIIPDSSTTLGIRIDYGRPGKAQQNNQLKKQDKEQPSLSTPEIEQKIEKSSEAKELPHRPTLTVDISESDVIIAKALNALADPEVRQKTEQMQSLEKKAAISPSQPFKTSAKPAEMEETIGKNLTDQEMIAFRKFRVQEAISDETSQPDKEFQKFIKLNREKSKSDLLIKDAQKPKSLKDISKLMEAMRQKSKSSLVLDQNITIKTKSTSKEILPTDIYLTKAQSRSIKELKSAGIKPDLAAKPITLKKTETKNIFPATKPIIKNKNDLRTIITPERVQIKPENYIKPKQTVPETTNEPRVALNQKLQPRADTWKNPGPGCTRLVLPAKNPMVQMAVKESIESPTTMLDKPVGDTIKKPIKMPPYKPSSLEKFHNTKTTFITVKNSPAVLISGVPEPKLAKIKSSELTTGKKFTEQELQILILKFDLLKRMWQEFKQQEASKTISNFERVCKHYDDVMKYEKAVVPKIPDRRPRVLHLKTHLRPSFDRIVKYYAFVMCEDNKNESVEPVKPTSTTVKKKKDDEDPKNVRKMCTFVGNDGRYPDGDNKDKN